MKIIIEIAADTKYCATCTFILVRYIGEYNDKKNFFCHTFDNEKLKTNNSKLFDKPLRCKACKQAEQLYLNLIKEKSNGNTPTKNS